jgi:hypothetical protein
VRDAMLRCLLVSVAGFAFQACAFNHSAISPFRINHLQLRLNRQNPELCQTLQCLAITYGYSSIAAEEESAEPVDAHRLRDIGSQLGVPSSN